MFLLSEWQSLLPLNYSECLQRKIALIKIHVLWIFFPQEKCSSSLSQVSHKQTFYWSGRNRRINLKYQSDVLSVLRKDSCLNDSNRLVSAVRGNDGSHNKHDKTSCVWTHQTFPSTDVLPRCVSVTLRQRLDGPSVFGSGDVFYVWNELTMFDSRKK